MYDLAKDEGVKHKEFLEILEDIQAPYKNMYEIQECWTKISSSVHML